MAEQQTHTMQRSSCLASHPLCKWISTYCRLVSKWPPIIRVVCTMYVVGGHRYIGIRFQLLLSFNWCVCHSLWHHYYHSLCSLSAAFISPNCSNLLNLTLIWIWIMGYEQTSDYEIVSINHSKKSFLFISWLMKCWITRRLHWNPFFHENMLIISTIVTVMRDAITIIPIIYLSQ